mgnify:CR=1 FL=1
MTKHKPTTLKDRLGALWGLLRGANLVLLDGWLRGRIHKDLSLFMVGGAANRRPYEV